MSSDGVPCDTGAAPPSHLLVQGVPLPLVAPGAAGRRVDLAPRLRRAVPAAAPPPGRPEGWRPPAAPSVRPGSGGWPSRTPLPDLAAAISWPRALQPVKRGCAGSPAWRLPPRRRPRARSCSAAPGRRRRAALCRLRRCPLRACGQARLVPLHTGRNTLMCQRGPSPIPNRRFPQWWGTCSAARLGLHCCRNTPHRRPCACSLPPPVSSSAGICQGAGAQRWRARPHRRAGRRARRQRPPGARAACSPATRARPPRWPPSAAPAPAGATPPRARCRPQAGQPRQSFARGAVTQPSCAGASPASSAADWDGMRLPAGQRMSQHSRPEAL